MGKQYAKVNIPDHATGAKFRGRRRKVIKQIGKQKNTGTEKGSKNKIPVPSDVFPFDRIQREQEKNKGQAIHHRIEQRQKG